MEIVEVVAVAEVTKAVVSDTDHELVTAQGSVICQNRTDLIQLEIR